MDNISALENLKSHIRPHLRNFLLEEGIEISDNGMLLCVNPTHTDTNASMKILSDLNNEQLFCYGCNTKGDIFTANHWIGGAPVTGLEFVTDNVYSLAKRFSIPYDDIELSQEQLTQLEEYRFNKIVAETITTVNEREECINWTPQHAEERGWSKAICKKLHISTVESYNKLLKSIQALTGHTVERVKELGLTPDLFGSDMLTFTMFDEKGRPVGFSSRYLGWTEDSKRPKYKNSAHSSIYQKSKLLYGLHAVNRSRGSRLDIFEGNGSFVTAYQAGHNSCASLCGSSFTDEQVDLIQRLGFDNVNLVLDSDSTGERQMDKYMRKLSGREGLRISITKLKWDIDGFCDGKDPDDFIRTYGIKDFFKLRPTSAFEYYIEQESEKAKQGTTDVYKFVNKMLKLIQNTVNRIERGKQITTLAESTGVDERDIRDEMDRLTAESVGEVKRSLSKKLHSATSTDELLSVMDTMAYDIRQQSGTKEERTRLSIDESLANFKNLITILDNKKAGLQGWKTGFGLLDSKLSGIPKPIGVDEYGEKIPIPGSIMGIAGAPQHGKSTVIQNIAYRIASLNEDVVVLYWALDDSRERTLERMLSMHSGVSWKAVTRRVSLSSHDRKKLEKSVKFFEDLISKGKLVMKDHSIGSTLPLLKRWVEETQRETDKPILLLIDSFHKISAASTESNLTEPAKAKFFSQWMKAFVQTHNVTVIASLEMNKGQGAGHEPALLNITETRKIEFDFDIIATVYNHYYDMDTDSNQVLIQPGGKVIPLIKFNIRKSKDGGSGVMWFGLNTDNFSIKDYSLEDVRALTILEEVKDTKVNGITISTPDKGSLKKSTLTEPWSK
jgi:DNA primase catalytic core